MQKCKECDYPLLTATSECTVFLPDSEPYESGVVQETEYDSIDEHVVVGILWCPEHGIQHTWIEEPQGERGAKKGNPDSVPLCRICGLAAATGDDGLCDGCRSAVVLERARIP